MPHIYLAPFTTSLMDADTLCWDAHQRQSLSHPIIDLRPISAQEAEPGLLAPEGYYFGIYDRQVVIPGATYFGDSLTAPLTLQQKNTWKGRVSIEETLEGSSVAEIIWNTLTVHAQASGVDRVRPLMPRSDRQLHLQLPGLQRRRSVTEQAEEWASILVNLQLIYEQTRDAVLEGNLPSDYHRRVLDKWCEKYGISKARYNIFIRQGLPDEGILPHQTSFTETWPTDGTTISSGQDQVWTENAGDYVVSSGQLTHNSGGNEADSKCETALSSDDLYSKVDITGVQSTGEHPFILGRYTFVAATQTYYGFRWNSGDYEFYKRVSGSFTKLDNATISEPTPTYSLYLELNGSSYSCEQPESTVRLSGTDSALAGQVRVGVRSRNANHAYGQVDAADLSGTPNIDLAGSLPAMSGSISPVALVSLAGSLPAQSGAIAAQQTLARTVTGSLPAMAGDLSAQQTLLRSLAGSLPTMSGDIATKYLIALAGSLPAMSGAISAQAITALTLEGSLPAMSGGISDLKYLIALTGNLPAQSGALSALQTLGISVAGNLPAMSGALSAQQTLAIAVAGSLPAQNGSLTLVYLIALTGNLPAMSGVIASEAVQSPVIVLPRTLINLGDFRNLTLLGDFRRLRSFG